MERKSEIKSAYKSLGKAHSFYDGMMTGTTLPGRLIQKIVWGMDKEDALEYQARSFEIIPSDFSGKLLEVPVGTGVPCRYGRRCRMRISPAWIIPKR